MTRASLRELAGPKLYRRNAFQVTGLPVDVDRRTARRRQQQMTLELRIRPDLDEPGLSAALKDLQAAFDAMLGDPRRRLVHEIFAPWGKPDGCGCPEGVHWYHDGAVKAHAKALEVDPADLLETTRSGQVPDSWSTAASEWTRTLRSASFWRHLHHRVKQIDDRQLDASIVDQLRAELPGALVRPLLHLVGSAQYPAPLRKSLSDWPVPPRELDRLVEEATEPLYTELDSLLGDLRARLESGDADEIVAELRERVNPLLARLEGLAPRDRYRRTATVRDRVAVLLNNCALAHYNNTGRHDSRLRAWLSEAEKLATDPETQRLIRQNVADFDESERDLDEFRARVYQIWRVHGRHAAERFLRGVLSQVSDEAAVRVIRNLLDELRAQAPVGYGYGYGYERTGAGRGWRWVAAFAVILGLLIFGIVRCQSLVDDDSGASAPREERVNVHQPNSRDNPPPVACVAEADDWRDDDSTVTIVDCAEAHWAEVFAYEPLLMGPGVAYPGNDQVARLARFLCLDKLDDFALSTETHDVEVFYSADPATYAVANTETSYVTCAARRLDDERWDSQAASPNPVDVRLPVRMPLTSRDGFLKNPPVGLCVQNKDTTKGWDEPRSIVPCDRPHWAQILGYPALGGASSEAEIAQHAQDTCQDLATAQQMFERYTVTAAWPRFRGDSPGYAVCLAHRTDDQLFQGVVS